MPGHHASGRRGGVSGGGGRLPLVGPFPGAIRAVGLRPCGGDGESFCRRGAFPSDGGRPPLPEPNRGALRRPIGPRRRRGGASCLGRPADPREQTPLLRSGRRISGPRQAGLVPHRDRGRKADPNGGRANSPGARHEGGLLPLLLWDARPSARCLRAFGGGAGEGRRSPPGAADRRLGKPGRKGGMPRLRSPGPSLRHQTKSSCSPNSPTFWPKR